MLRALCILIGAIAVAGVWAGAAMATGPVAAQAPDARLALFVRGETWSPGGAPDFTVLRQKGVTSVTNPIAGVFCVDPSSTTMKLGRIVPNVSTDASYTATDTVAMWLSFNNACPTNTIAVAGSDFSTNALNNQVAFMLTVP
jgi:hypothetical protein